MRNSVIIARAERVVAAYEAHWGELPKQRHDWLRGMIAGALVQQAEDRPKRIVETITLDEGGVGDDFHSGDTVTIIREPR